jgi:hypothetical protein
MRFYVSGENLAEWSEVDFYMDPEALEESQAGDVYPFQRRFSVGVNVNF